jgi:hypothetical protein
MKTRDLGLAKALGLVVVVVFSALPAGATITYTCAANVDAAHAGTCSTLNTTIAGLYSSAFTDVNAKIYLQMGTTGLGASNSVLNGVSYASYKAALAADSTSANDATAVANLPGSLAAPLPTGGMALANPILRALSGLGAPSVGYDSTGAFGCTITNAGCYDGIITINGTQPLWYRSGLQGSAYDFYAVAEHETDEVLGSGSCAPAGCFSGTRVSPLDLFRFTSNGARSYAYGTNDSCSGASTTNACFSINGGITRLLSYNNLNNGADTGDFATNCTFVQDAFGCLGGGAFDISPSAEILELDVIGYTLNAGAATPEPASVTLLGAGLALLAGYRMRRRGC